MFNIDDIVYSEIFGKGVILINKKYGFYPIHVKFNNNIVRFFEQNGAWVIGQKNPEDIIKLKLEV